MIFNRKVWDVVFYYPQHFNRGNNNSNAYLEPLIESCSNHNLSYLMVEEPDLKTRNSSKNPLAKIFNWFYVILILRKILPLSFFKNFESRERFMGRIINVLSLGNFRSKNYITLSNSLGGVLRGINPDAKIFDYQHGIITSDQQGFFVNNKAPDWIYSNRKEVLVYGKGFEEIMKNTDGEYYHDKVYTIGQTDKKMNGFQVGNNILVSLQILEDENVSFQWLQAQVELLDQLFNSYASHEKTNQNITIYLRHHPRSSKTFDLSKLFSYSFVKEFDGSTESYEIGLHITYFSTSAFEFASLGIPTLFLFNEIIPQGEKLFYKEFAYPYQNLNSIQDWLNALSNDKDISNRMKKWYQLFYQPFDEDKFINLLKNE